MKRFVSTGIAVIPVLLMSCTLFNEYPGKYGSAESFLVDSAFLEDSRDITVVLPGGYTTAKTYPLLYTLDGDWNVTHVSRIVDDLVGDGEIAEHILVFIGNGDGETREKDYHYPDGNGDLFYEFLTNELIPHIDNKYSTDPATRSLIGHSSAGYFVLYALMRNTGETSGFFKGYLAASPPVFLSDGALFAMEENKASSQTSLPGRLAVGVGSLEGVLFNTSVSDFASTLESRNYSGFELRFEMLKGVSHHSTEYLMYRKELAYVLGY